MGTGLFALIGSSAKEGTADVIRLFLDTVVDTGLIDLEGFGMLCESMVAVWCFILTCYFVVCEEITLSRSAGSSPPHGLCISNMWVGSRSPLQWLDWFPPTRWLPSPVQHDTVVNMLTLQITALQRPRSFNTGAIYGGRCPMRLPPLDELPPTTTFIPFCQAQQ